MSIELVTGRMPPAVALRHEIAKRRNSPALAISGLAPLLDVLDAYIAATEARVRHLEEKASK